MDFLTQINLVEILSSFIVLFVIIDVTGSIPIFLSLKSSDKNIKAGQACLVALVMFVAFFYAGDRLLDLFSVDVASFAVAGSFVIFILALEMVLGFDIIKYDNQGSNVSVVPVAFPLLAGPGALTALLSLRADYSVINIMLGLFFNLILAYVVIRFVGKIEKWLGKDFIFILRKFFGVILLALAVKLFASNLTIVISELAK
jgi:multiple antibiotic resistance protein